MKDKLQNPDILRFLLTFHIVWLLETKTNAHVTVPGFSVHSNPSKHGHHRGGIIMLVKSCLVRFVKKVDLSYEGQIWLELTCFPEFIFGGVYIPPDDSMYYDVSQFGFLSANVHDRKRVIVMGDFNARVGTPLVPDTSDSPLSYVGVKDVSVNGHGRRLLMCA